MMARCHHNHHCHHPSWAINDGQCYAIASLINSNCTLFFNFELRQCDNWRHFCFSPAVFLLSLLFSFELIKVSLSGFRFVSVSVITTDSNCSIQLNKTPLVFIKSYSINLAAATGGIHVGWTTATDSRGIADDITFKNLLVNTLLNLL